MIGAVILTVVTQSVREPTAKVNRRDWIDIVRAVAILGVVFVHSVRLTSAAIRTEFQWLENANLVFTPLRIPLLFLLSGLLVAKSLEKSKSRFVLGKMRRLLYPFLLWTVLYFLFQFSIDHQMSLSNLVTQFVDPQGVVWFIGYLFLYYLLALLTRRVNPLIIAAVAIALTTVTIDGLEIDGQWDRFWARMAPFFIGVAIGYFLDGFEKFAAKNVWLSVTLSIGAAWAMIVNILWDGGGDDELRRTTIVVIFFVGIAGLLIPVSGGRFLAFARYVGKRTIKILLLHWICIQTVLYTIAIPLGIKGHKALLISLVAGYLGSLVVVFLADRFRWVDWLFEWQPKPVPGRSWFSPRKSAPRRRAQ